MSQPSPTPEDEEEKVGKNTEIAKLMERIFPDPSVRRRCLHRFADALTKANAIDPKKWDVKPLKDRVRLNVGKIAVFTLIDNQVWIVLDSPSTTLRQKLGDRIRPEGEFALVPGSLGVYIRPEHLEEVWPLVKESHWRLLQKAADTVLDALPKNLRNELSPIVRDYVRSFIDREIPDPENNHVAPKPNGKENMIINTIERHLKSKGFQFTTWQIATFYTALQAKGFVILSGISGTGKSKLAQYFTDLLPKPTGIESIAADDLVSLTIQPYMLRYNRFIIPKQATRLFDPPPPGKAQQVQLQFGDDSQECRLVHAAYGNSDYVSLLLRGKAREWFAETFQVGDTLFLEPELDQENSLTGFRLFNSLQENHISARGQTALKNHLFIPVRPDWRDSKSLLGYYNPLTGAYQWTPFLRFLLQALQSYRAEDGIAWLVILDEMNLAHVEYYFADLLSVLESGRDNDGMTREPLRLYYPDEAEGDLPPRELYLPPNLYVVGTVNVDETTHAFSPKVLDRAFTLELTEADFSNYPPRRNESDFELTEEERRQLLDDFTFNGRFVRIDKAQIAAYLDEQPDIRSRLQQLNNLLQQYNLHFGYRVFDEIISYLQAAQDSQVYTQPGLRGMDEAFDTAVLMKVLPKFHGSRGKLERPLKDLLAWCVTPDAPNPKLVTEMVQRNDDHDIVLRELAELPYTYPHTAAKVQRMLRALFTTGFAAFG
jgi:5-methylcytosine-specific restriction enzyme B